MPDIRHATPVTLTRRDAVHRLAVGILAAPAILRGRFRLAPDARTEYSARAIRLVQESLVARDERDSQRKASPLMVALGAQVIDTSAMTVEQVVEKILSVVRGL